MPDNISVFDCDGHIIESIPEMVSFLDPVDREVAHAHRDATDRRGVFARGAAQLRRPALSVSLGLAVAVLMLITFAVGHGSRGTGVGASNSIPPFDAAIDKYLVFERDFVPNVPTEAFASNDGTVYAWVQNRDAVQRVSTEADDVFAFAHRQKFAIAPHVRRALLQCVLG